MREGMIILFMALAMMASATEFHVAKTGDDGNSGSWGSPFLTIQHASNTAQPGDVITVHAGIYRERIDPPRGGTSETQRIVYQAAANEEVVISGAEQITGWVYVANDTWKVKVPNALFGDFNPYRGELKGHWYVELNNRRVHQGSLFLNGHWHWESPDYSTVLAPQGDTPYWFTNDKTPGDDGDLDDDGYDDVTNEAVFDVWTNEGDEATMTTIWAQFKGMNPNNENVEINTREAVFYPEETGRDFITVRGFILEKAATPWAPPTTEQVGLIGCNWSKGWVIEDNIIRYSKCTGVTLGKYDAGVLDTYDYVNTIDRAADHQWDEAHIGSHIVRNNHISNCEMAGIVGSLGPIFSEITGNTIKDIHIRKLFYGFEMAGIKLHGALDCLIADNNISHTSIGIWLDWMAEGTRVTGNYLSQNDRDMFFEVNHGPFLVDNNVLGSYESMRSVSRGGSYAHNLFMGRMQVIHNEGRLVPKLQPHSTEVIALQVECPSGDEHFYNNIFYGYGLQEYDASVLPVTMEGNVFLNGAIPCEDEVSPIVDLDSDAVKLVPEADGAYLHMQYDPAWDTSRQLVNTALLGTTYVSNAVYENPDGTPYSVDQDFFKVDRDSANPCAGPFAFAGSEINRIKLYSYEGGVAAANVLAHWSFDAPSAGGRYIDDSGNGKDIEVTVAPVHITNGQKFGAGALDFSGAQYLTLPDNAADGVAALPLANNSFSISFWAKRKNNNINQYALGMSDPRYPGSRHADHGSQGLHIGFRSPAATVDFYDNGYSIEHIPHTPTDTTEWHHYVVTYNKETKEQVIAIDGDIATSDVSRVAIGDFLGDINQNTTAADINNDFWIGRTFLTNDFDGYIDEVWVFDKDLSEGEIYNMYLYNQLSGTSAPQQSAQINTFSGGDLGEGLVLNDEYVYAVNISGNATYPPVIQGVTFPNDAQVAGATVSLGGGGTLAFEYWGTRPEYGSSAADNWLESLMQATSLSYGANAHVNVDLEVTAGTTYELQLLFSENAFQAVGSRAFDITVEGAKIVDEFTNIPAGAAWSAAPHTGVIVTYQVTATDGLLNIELTSGSGGGPDPVIQAVLLEEISAGSPVGVGDAYDAWTESFLPLEIGPETNNYDGDSKNNFYEYAFGGDPTNEANTALPLSLEAVGSELHLSHMRRSDDSALQYKIQSNTTLDPNTWSDYSPAEVGNVEMGTQSSVTNSVDMNNSRLFFRLSVER